MSIPICLAFSPEEAARARATGHPLACMGYQLLADSPGLLAPDPMPEGASAMLLQDSIQPQYTPTPVLTALIVQYASACHTGLICDCARPRNSFWEGLLHMLDASCHKASLPLWVPEAYAAFAPHALVMVPSGVTSGNYRMALQQAAASYPGRCVLELRPVRSRLSAGSHQVEEAVLEQAQLEQLLPACTDTVFFSEALCCSGMTFLERRVPSLILFDTKESIRLKLQIAEAAGFSSAVMLLQEAEGFLPLT